MKDSLNLPIAGPDPILHIYLREANCSLRMPKLGLSLSSGYQAHYLGPQDCHPTPLELVTGPVEDGKCGFWEISSELMPGLYGLQIPPYLRKRGYTYIHLQFPDTHPHYLELHGVEYDPYDSFALGLTTWIRVDCHEHLTSGLRKSMPTILRPLLVDWLSGT